MRKRLLMGSILAGLLAGSLSGAAAAGPSLDVQVTVLEKACLAAGGDRYGSEGMCWGEPEVLESSNRGQIFPRVCEAFGYEVGSRKDPGFGFVWECRIGA